MSQYEHRIHTYWTRRLRHRFGTIVLLSPACDDAYSLVIFISPNSPRRVTSSQQCRSTAFRYTTEASDTCQQQLSTDGIKRHRQSAHQFSTYTYWTVGCTVPVSKTPPNHPATASRRAKSLYSRHNPTRKARRNKCNHSKFNISTPIHKCDKWTNRPREIDALTIQWGEIVNIQRHSDE